MKSLTGITSVIVKGGSKNEISKWYHLSDRTPWFPKLISKWSHFGDRPQEVPANCIMDNLKAAVIRSTTDNDMIARSYQELAEHYGFIISPCPPRTPEHKGGVEGDVKYVKRNFLPYFRARQEEKNIKIPKICELIEALERWNKEVADVHLIHGIKKSPLEIFKSEEEKALRPLPKERWEPTTWYKSTVRRDWRIMIDSAFYSVPYQLIGKTVEVCITDSFVRIFHEGKQVALHPRAKPQAYQRKAEHAPPFKEAVLQCFRDGLLALAQDIGPFTYKMAQGIFANPTVDKLKPVRCLIRLAEKYGQQRLEKACQRAVNCSLFSYKSVKNILEKNLESEEPKTASKIIPYAEFRFCRNSDDYKIQPGTFEEKLVKIHPYSKHGNAMAGVRRSAELDQAMDALLEDELMPNNEFVNHRGRAISLLSPRARGRKGIDARALTELAMGFVVAAVEGFLGRGRLLRRELEKSELGDAAMARAHGRCDLAGQRLA